MGACDQGEGKNAETSKKETAVKPEKKTNERELNKKSESLQIQDEQKDLRAYATKVEEERKAKELAQQTAKEEAEAPVSQETIDNYEANQAGTWAEEAEIEEQLNQEEEEKLAKEQEEYEKQIIAEQDANFSDEAKEQIRKEIDEEGYSKTSYYCDQVMTAVQRGDMSKDEAGGCLK
ncbi:hypothetical protein J7E51_24060 [Priestia megaterium]|nr:hypothetical protein [Priestia megaterium]